MTSTLHLRDLSPADVGRMVSLRSHDGTTITGPLRAISTETDWITEVSLSENPDEAEPVPGRQTISVQVGPWSCEDLAPSTGVEVAR